MRHERGLKNSLPSTMGAGADLLILLLEWSPTAAIGGDLGQIRAPPSTVEPGVMKKQQRLGRP